MTHEKLIRFYDMTVFSLFEGLKAIEF